MLGTGASLAGLSIGVQHAGPASAMSGPDAIERADLDGLSISQVRDKMVINGLRSSYPLSGAACKQSVHLPSCLGCCACNR